MLESLWEIWTGHGRTMTEEQWKLPTRLGDWNVRSLYAHVAAWPHGLAAVAGQVRAAEPTHPRAADLLRQFNTPGGVADSGRERVAANARSDADRYSTDQMIESFSGTGQRALATARGLGPVVVDYFGLGLLPIDEVISIGVVESTVHLLDLRRALGLPVDLPAEALEHTAAVLAQMAPPVAFIEAATGRGSADLFPVLS
ncbi:maleylpyruvate isomerase family mycothiol-dependent enzyme [Actinoplanes sp. GCM10030250]|uniref:maleylpyruvate isomerase family mycothiol-dependent enzyme n=1 Tax=Actinoplanes sp. GCM10030250 TaxID=3273376 RepID=UPI0036192E17